MRLIDADALITNRDLHIVIGAGDNICIDIADIAKAPTIDAEPFERGRWVLQRYYGGMRKGMVSRIICSECGYPNDKTNYCPQCGAKMDGDGNA